MADARSPLHGLPFGLPYDPHVYLCPFGVQSVSELRIDRYTMPAANLGPASPMVPLWYDTAELAVPRKPVGLGKRTSSTSGTATTTAACLTSCRTTMTGPARRVPSRPPCWRTRTFAPRSCWNWAGGSGRCLTSGPIASCCTSTPSSSPPTWACATPGSAAAWSGTSAGWATRRSPSIPSSPRARSSMTVRRS